MNNLTTIREALKYSFHLGIHSDLEWFTNLQYRALRALREIEDSPGTALGDVEDNTHSGIPNISAVCTDAAHTACPWPPGECEE